MENLDAKLLTVLLLALPAAAVLGAWIGARYRQRMVRLMRAGVPPDADAARPVAPSAGAGTSSNASFDLADNGRRNRRIGALLVAVSLAIGLSVAAFELIVVVPDAGFGVRRWSLLGLVYAWPAVPALGLLRRWPLWRTALAVLAYMAALLPLIMLASTEVQSGAEVAGWLAATTALPMLALLCLTVSGRIRAVAPLLFPLLVLLFTASVLGLELAAAWVEAPPPALVALVETVGAMPALALFVLAPWVVAALPALMLLRALAARYRAKAFSELSFLFGTLWLVVLVAMALPATHSAGLAAFGLIGAILWVPAGFALARRWLRAVAVPPTLLVLRVFQRDAEVAALFDRVTERWRASGNTVLIAGTDLISRTLDADDLFTYLGGRLAERFIATPDEVSRRIAGFDLRPDHDGRFRINECYCTDASWQAALAALVARADHVLMDLRGFAAHNAGCRFELGELGCATHLRRVVVLHDGRTDRATAQADLGAAAPRVAWIDMGRAGGEAVLRALAA